MYCRGRGSERAHARARTRLSEGTVGGVCTLHKHTHSARYKHIIKFSCSVFHSFFSHCWESEQRFWSPSWRSLSSSHPLLTSSIPHIPSSSIPHIPLSSHSRLFWDEAESAVRIRSQSFSVCYWNWLVFRSLPRCCVITPYTLSYNNFTHAQLCLILPFCPVTGNTQTHTHTLSQCGQSLMHTLGLNGH